MILYFLGFFIIFSIYYCLLVLVACGVNNFWNDENNFSNTFYG